MPPHETHWTFAAGAGACEACRALDAESTPPGGPRFAFLNSVNHGCTKAAECACGCALVGVWLETPQGPRPFTSKTAPPFRNPMAPLVATVSVSPLPSGDGWTEPPDGMTMTMREAVAFRRLGEEAEAAGQIHAAIRHYQQAVDLWWLVGCRRRLHVLRMLQHHQKAP